MAERRRRLACTFSYLLEYGWPFTSSAVSCFGDEVDEHATPEEKSVSEIESHWLTTLPRLFDDFYICSNIVDRKYPE